MASTPSYRHKPLEHEDSIRVLLLLPSTNPEDPIRIELTPCRLSEVELHTGFEPDFDAKLDPGPPKHQDGSKYEALSYTWGDPRDTAPIYIGYGATASLPVTRNCLNALKALRQKDLPRHMWIDAICIDQTNLKERSSQVRMMARIFADGLRTVIYLGEQTTSSQVVFEFAADLAKKYGIDIHQMARQKELPPPELVRGLGDLVQRPWFQRVWVAQEVFMNNRRVILCGETILPYETLDFLFEYYWVHVWSGKLMPFTWNPEFDLEIYGISSSTFFTSDLLWISLLNSRELLASDRRDKIFAMKALIGKQHVELDPLIDYSKTPEQVFTSVAKIFLHRFGLQILGLVRYGHDLHMPSWVPDWSQNTPLSDDLKLAFEESRSRHLSEDSKFEVESIDSMEQRMEWSLSEADMLQVRGWPLGDIVEIGDAFLFHDFNDAKQQLHAVACLVEEDWGQVTTEKQDLITTRKHFPGKIFQELQALTTFRTARHFLSRKDYRDSGKYDRSSMDIRPDMQWVTRDIMKALQKCRVFLSDDGYIGIVPQIAEEGDILVGLELQHSKKLYIILRPAQDGHWRLISGDCHAVRIDGKIFKDSPGDPEEFILS